MRERCAQRTLMRIQAAEGANDTQHAAPPGSTGTAPEHSQPPKPDAR
ncbi:hypothetical protein [Ralstonia solanacearum]|nr:hypothetical protein [Ralstonia solanacearum]